MSRIGEEKINNFGSKMKIIEYRNCNDIDIYFEEYNYIVTNKAYREFKKGKIKCPFEPRTYGIGYIGVGKYKTKINGKTTIEYEFWKGMLRRCYDPYYINKEMKYIDIIVDERWHNFQNFAEWLNEEFYYINEPLFLDKDILYKNKKMYSPETCILVPKRINNLFIKSDYKKDLPVGVFPSRNGYVARCRITINNKSISKTLGYFNDEYKAFNCYKEFKENYIKQVADEYYDLIPRELYKAMYEYKVEIDD